MPRDLGVLLVTLMLAVVLFLPLNASYGAPANPASEFTMFDPGKEGFTQEVFGVTTCGLGGVAFAQNGDPLVNGCNAPTMVRFHKDLAFVKHETTLHNATTIQLPVYAVGIANHPDGYLYLNTRTGVRKINDSGTEFSIGGKPVGGVGAPGNNLGIAVQPKTNDIFYVTSGNGIGTIDPVTGNFTLLLNVSGAYIIDQIAFDAEGKFLYLADNGNARVLGIDTTSTPATVSKKIPLTVQPDGMAWHIPSKTLFVNSNQGTIERIDPVTGNVTRFASGAYRGDMAQVGPDGYLYLTEDAVRYVDGTVGNGESSLVRIGPGFAAPPGLSPKANDDSAQTKQDTPVTIRIMDNDKDPYGGALALSAIANPSNGKVTKNNDGTVEYTPRSGFIGSDAFSYTIANAGGRTATAKVTVQVSNMQELVVVVNNSTSSIAGANVTIAGKMKQSDLEGRANFTLSAGNYNVTASYPDYPSVSAMVDMDRGQIIYLNFPNPYIMQGQIPSPDITIKQVTSGYNVTLRNTVTPSSSAAIVFFNWKKMGEIPQGSEWAAFQAKQLPDHIVIAASRHSVDYPKAWYYYPIPPMLKATTGNEGSFMAESTPYLASSIFVNPYPPVKGQVVTIGVRLHNPFATALNISRIDFQVSELTIGGRFGTVGEVSNVNIDANQTRVFTVPWNATLNGHHCVRVVLTYPPSKGGLESMAAALIVPIASSDLPKTQALQWNLEIENNLPLGSVGQFTFLLSNPTTETKDITLKVAGSLPDGWHTDLSVNGQAFSTNPKIVLHNVPPGGSLAVTPRIFSTSSGIANVNIEGYIDDGTLIGGVRKTMSAGMPLPSLSTRDGSCDGILSCLKDVVIVLGVIAGIAVIAIAADAILAEYGIWHVGRVSLAKLIRNKISKSFEDGGAGEEQGGQGIPERGSLETDPTGFKGSSGFELKNPKDQPLRNEDSTIENREYSGHALDDMQNRGIMPSVVDNTIKNGISSADPIAGRVRFYDPVNNVSVVTEGDRIVSVRFGDFGKGGDETVLKAPFKPEIEVSDFPRALTKEDLAVEGELKELRGTFDVQNEIAVVHIDKIDGDIRNPFGVVDNLKKLANAKGASTLRIKGYLANERFMDVLVKRYGLTNVNGIDVIEIPLQ